MYPRSRANQLATVRALWRHPRAKRDQLLTFQSSRLHSLLRHVYANVPFYRRLYDEAGCSPYHVRSAEDLPRLPIITKQQLRGSRPDDTVAIGTDPSRLVGHLTSGSTGEPLKILRSAPEENLLSMFRLRARRQFGVRPRDRTAAIREPHLGGDADTLAARIAHAANLFRVETIDCMQAAEHITAELARVDPDVVVGYPSALALVARQAIARRSPRIRPRVVGTGGEPLSPVVRRQVEAAFDAPLFEIYGAHECNTLAWQCPEQRLLHVSDDCVIVEVLRDGVPVAEGETGEVVLTSLHSYTMPFVRYALGDVAVQGPVTCPCGQPFSTLRSVQGRTAGYFHLSNGRSVHPFAITGPMLEHDRAWIDRHQMVQESRDRVVLRIAPLRQPLVEELERLQRLGDGALGPETRFRIELADEFPPGPGGKTHSYRSLVGDEILEP